MGTLCKYLSSFFNDQSLVCCFIDNNAHASWICPHTITLCRSLEMEMILPICIMMQFCNFYQFFIRADDVDKKLNVPECVAKMQRYAFTPSDFSLRFRIRSVRRWTTAYRKKELQSSQSLPRACTAHVQNFSQFEPRVCKNNAHTRKVLKNHSQQLRLHEQEVLQSFFSQNEDKKSFERNSSESPWDWRYLDVMSRGCIKDWDDVPIAQQSACEHHS